MNPRMINNEDVKTKRSKLIRRIIQANANDGPLSTRKSYSPSSYNTGQNASTSKNNIANNIIMRRQLNATNDISPPKGKYGYTFIYDQTQAINKEN